MSRSFDIVVIGGGIAGVSAAWELSKLYRVAVLEQEGATGTHTTGRSAGVFTENYGSEAIRRLTLASRAFFEEPPNEFSQEPLMIRRAVMVVARKGDEALLKRALVAARSIVPSIRSIDRSAALKLCPIVRPDYLGAAFVEPDAFDIEVATLQDGYERGIRARRGQIVVDARVASCRRVSGAWEVRTERETYHAAVVVNAAGAWADEVGIAAGCSPIGLIPKRRTVVLVASPPNFDPRWPLVTDVNETYYFKPEGGRIMVSPMDETPEPPGDSRPTMEDVALAADRLGEVTSINVRSIVRRWSGLRSFVADANPVLGEDPSQPGFFWFAAQGGFGIMTAPAMARIVSSLITEHKFPAGIPEEIEGVLTPRRLVSAA